MIAAKFKPDQKPLSAVASTLERVFRPDPVIPEPMLALLRSMDLPPAFVAAGALPARKALHP